MVQSGWGLPLEGQTRLGDREVVYRQQGEFEGEGPDDVGDVEELERGEEAHLGRQPGEGVVLYSEMPQRGKLPYTRREGW